GWTWSAWVKAAALQPNAALYSRRDGANALVIGFDNGAPYVEVTNNSAVQRSGTAAPVPVNSWHHLAVVAAAGGEVTLYLHGNAYATLYGSLPPLNTLAFVGGDNWPSGVTPAAAADASAQAPVADGGAATANAAPAPAATSGFAGDIDELEISKVARPAGFIRLAAIGQGLDQGKLVSFSV